MTTHKRVGRREFIKGVAGSRPRSRRVRAASCDRAREGSVRTDADTQGAQAARPGPRIRFGVIGLNHSHINSQVSAVQRGGGELVAMYAKEPDLVDAFVKRNPKATRARSEQRDSRGQVDSARAERGHSRRACAARHPRDAARQGLHGRQARHHDARAARRGPQGAGETAPHLLDHVQRAHGESRDGQGGRTGAGRGHRPRHPDDRAGPAPHHPDHASGMVLGQGSSSAASSATSRRIRPTSSCTSRARPRRTSSPRRSATSITPTIQGSKTSATSWCAATSGTGYIRVDWFTPDGLSTWGDGRLTILGTDGFIEIRKNVDIGGRAGGNHLFLVDQKETRYVDCTDVALPYGARSSPTSSIARKPRCHRRTASWRPS